MAMPRIKKTHPSDIYVRKKGGQWSVYLQTTMINAIMLEGGFFAHDAAMDACRRWREEIAAQEKKGGGVWKTINREQ